MLGYRFYCSDEMGKNQLIGILPERRFKPERITDRSIVNWVREIVGNGCHGRTIHFVRVKMPAGEQEVY
jgi:hypothetical protein